MSDEMIIATIPKRGSVNGLKRFYKWDPSAVFTSSLAFVISMVSLVILIMLRVTS